MAIRHRTVKTTLLSRKLSVTDTDEVRMAPILTSAILDFFFSLAIRFSGKVVTRPSIPHNKTLCQFGNYKTLNLNASTAPGTFSN